MAWTTTLLQVHPHAPSHSFVKLFGAVVVLTHLYDLPRAHLVGVLTVATIGFSTGSTMAWMSR